MDKVDFVLVGSEAVVESGGLVNAVGSNQIAIIARAANKPFYALAERYFFILGYDIDLITETHFWLSATSSTACSRYHNTISQVTIQKFFHFPVLSWPTAVFRQTRLFTLPYHPQAICPLPLIINRISHSLQE